MMSNKTKRRQASMRRTRWLWWAAAAVVLVLVVALRYLVPDDEGEVVMHPTTGSRTLVVLVHGLSGREGIEPVVTLAKELFPGADLLVPRYPVGLLANSDPYGIANQLEREIHAAHTRNTYASIVIVGHSMGAMILRKALLWGYGLEEDRARFGARSKREWVERVERFVSLAGINRGWSIEPRPREMSLAKYIGIWVGEKFARLTGTGGLILAMQRGAPFIADARVQWIRLARSAEVLEGQRKLPLVLQLLGDRDDIVSREDSVDLAAAKDIRFVTLPNTDHADIAQVLATAATTSHNSRSQAVRWALLGELDKLDIDRVERPAEDLSIRRMVYLMHGIRDYGEWTEPLREAINRAAPPAQSGIAVVPPRYGYFPMLPFLFYWDRQKNVRTFMDEYTENLAQYPRADEFDFVGHSNGTYILASALQQYATLRAGRVFFAGSVVPKHYPWRDLIDAGRVRQVRNSVATGDWVVAIFPKLYEQVADWLGRKPTMGFLDLGSAGFRGFEDASEAGGRVRNLQFVAGSHGTGVDVANGDKLRALAAYIVAGDESGLIVFEDASQQSGTLSTLSNVSWSVWLVLALLFGGLGYAVVRKWRWKGGAVYGLLLLALLNSF
jgi:pimeloyl-ACP methyl ester carboxylesterase